MKKRSAAWGLALALSLPIPWFRKPERSRSWGGISRVVVNRALNRQVKVAQLAQVNFKDFLYRVYPTPASDIGISHGPLIAGPLSLPVTGGHYSLRQGDQSLNFQIYRTRLVPLPRAPGGMAALAFGILYQGEGSESCAGIVQEYDFARGKLILVEQFSYNCRGGGSAEYLPRQRRLHISSSHYALGDRLCCPSLSDQMDFELDGDRSRAKNVDLAD